MVKCKICDREFKSKSALGGHMSTAHQGRRTGEEAQAQASPSPAAPAQLPAPVVSEATPGEAEQIRSYWQQGYTFEQLTTELGFKPTTVRQVISKMIHPKGKPETEKEEGKVPTLPLVLKDGKGEMISPEAVYYQLVADDGINGERDFRALMKWAASIEMVQRMTQIRKGEAEAFAETIKPMLDMMEKSRQELDAAAARAKESSIEIAEAAAAGAAARATMHVDQKFEELKKQKADIATVQDPMKGLMARTMESMMDRLNAMMLGGGSQPALGPGFVDKRQQEGGE
jgi:hypothetical protein